MVNFKKIFKVVKNIVMIPLNVGSQGMKSVGEVSKVTKEVQTKKIRTLYFKGNRMVDRVLDIKDDLFVMDLYKEHLGFKETTFLDEQNNELMVMTDGYPKSHNVPKLGTPMRVVESKVIDIKNLDAEKAELTYERVIYGSVDIHQKDTLDLREFSMLMMKVITSKILEMMEPPTKTELMMTLLFGMGLGGFIAMTLAYWISGG